MGKKKITILETFLITMLFCVSAPTLGIHIKHVDETSCESHTQSSKENIPTIPYTGCIRVYVVEPGSRWNNYAKHPYHFGFLDFALDENLSIEYLDTYTKNVTWSAQDAGFNNVLESNIMVIATVFNPRDKKGYANPPTKNPFDAYYVDATAAATPGKTGKNTVAENFTHTIFIEEATATWCPYCPVMAEKLYEIYESGEYPFYFVALVADKNPVAENRLLQDYNLYAYPTSFFDGGYKVLVGAYDNESYYTNRIKQCGARDVHSLNLTLSVKYLGNGVLTIEVAIVNNEEMTNTPPNLPTIDGPSNGRSGKEYGYNISTIDPEGDTVFYSINWGDNTEEVFIGPYSSGKKVLMNHTWNDKDTYIIQVKAKDIYDAESDWATLEVSMPKIRTYNPIIELLLKMVERFPFLHSLSFS